MRKIFTALLLFVLVSVELRAAQVALYADSGNTQTGDGSVANPYSRLSLINWLSISNQIAGGNSVSINLKAGSTFREIFNVGASGTSNSPLMIQSYAQGNPPVIACDKVVSGWTSSPSSVGQIW